MIAKLVEHTVKISKVTGKLTGNEKNEERKTLDIPPCKDEKNAGQTNDTDNVQTSSSNNQPTKDCD